MSKAYFFTRDQYARYDVNADTTDSGYPQPIAGNWPGLPFADGIDAVVVWNNGKAFFFKGGQYARYDMAADRTDDGYPLPIAGNWPGLPFTDGINAGVLWNNGKAFFFKGSQYARYDVAADKTDDGYPLPIAGNWPGLPFTDGIDAVVLWNNGKAFFFKGSQYARYDVAADKTDDGYPLPIAGNWPGLPFSQDLVSVNMWGVPQVAPATLFSFDLQPGEAIGDRIGRCCKNALADGPMGQHQRHDFYRDFISCRQEKTQQDAERLTGVRTSCAMFVRAVRQWCGAPSAGPYKSGTGMFVSMGNVNFSHPAFVARNAANSPNPGDYFYIASSKVSNDGHTGIFIEALGDNQWRTAEGGGGDGTTCSLTTRTVAGNKFANDGRTLWGWFDCTKVGLPESP